MKSVKLESLPLEMVWIADRLGIDKWEGLPVRETLEREFFVSQNGLEALARYVAGCIKNIGNLILRSVQPNFLRSCDFI